MDELDDGGHLVMLITLIAQSTGGQQHKGRTHALAAAVDDVLGNLPDERDVGVQTPANDRIDGIHVRADQGGKMFQCHDRQFYFEARNLRWQSRGSQGRQIEDAL